jgi:hypothetical protein
LNEEDILILELKQGTYVRSKKFEYTELFDTAEEEFSKISSNEWIRLTQDVKHHLNQYGDAKLVRFKVGF